MSTKAKKKFSAWNILWMLPLLAVIAAAVMMYVIPAFENVDRTPVAGSDCWMERLPDETLLSDIVLPGTHDSATTYVQLAYFSKCQALMIREQLETGFRYLDIRLGTDGNELKLMHGWTNCTTGGFPWSGALYLDEVLSDCFAFLKAHPTETVVFAVKHEHVQESTEEFQRILDDYVSRDPDMWLLASDIPTLGEARGKLVLMRRHADLAGLGERAGISFYWPQQDQAEDFSLAEERIANGAYTLTVQDRFVYNTEDKWTVFLKGLAASGTGEDSVLVNFLSTKGTAKYGHPYAFARQLDPRLMELDAAELNGWIVVDFASAKLAEHIYSANFR